MERKWGLLQGLCGGHHEAPRSPCNGSQTGGSRGDLLGHGQWRQIFLGPPQPGQVQETSRNEKSGRRTHRSIRGGGSRGFWPPPPPTV